MSPRLAACFFPHFQRPADARGPSPPEHFRQGCPAHGSVLWCARPCSLLSFLPAFNLASVPSAASGDGGVIKTIVKEGSGWAKPQSQDEVCVRFSARVQVRQPGGRRGASCSSRMPGLRLAARTLNSKPLPCHPVASHTKADSLCTAKPAQLCGKLSLLSRPLPLFAPHRAQPSPFTPRQSRARSSRLPGPPTSAGPSALVRGSQAGMLAGMAAVPAAFQLGALEMQGGAWSVCRHCLSTPMEIASQLPGTLPHPVCPSLQLPPL